MASTPANGPKPTTLIQIKAQISVSTPRKVSNVRRAKKCITRLILVLRAANEASGKANIAETNVPKNAMATVSAMACR